jgi:glycosyltransferase involved in cell wall biosynthesis
MCTVAASLAVTRKPVRANKVSKKVIRALALFAFLAWNQPFAKRDKFRQSSIDAFGSDDVLCDFQEYVSHLENAYRAQATTHISPTTLANVQNINHILGKITYTGIFLSVPAPVHFLPLQRPQRLFQELAHLGYLTVWVDDSAKEVTMYEPGIILVPDVASVIVAFRNRAVILMISWLVQSAVIDLFPKASIWYDLLDDPTLASCYDVAYLKRHQSLAVSAILRTATTNHLIQKYNAGHEWFLSPNAASLAEMAVSADVLDAPTSVVFMGVMESYVVEVDILRQIAKALPHVAFHVHGGIATSKFPANVHFHGRYNESDKIEILSRNSIGLMLFPPTEISRGVSPIKMYEYICAGWNVVSLDTLTVASDIPYVHTASTVALLAEHIRRLLNTRRTIEELNEMKMFCEENSWRYRAQSLIHHLHKGSLDHTNSLKVIHAHSNFLYANETALFSVQFYEFAGLINYMGGAERYYVDLSALFAEHGMLMVTYQCGTYSWLRRFKGMWTVSLSRSGDSFSVDDQRDTFFFLHHGRTELNIYSSFTEASGNTAKPAIGISHGVFWDGEAGSDPIMSRLDGALQSIDLLVSVDTNTIHWVQTRHYHVAQRAVYIPNYAAVDEMKETARRSDTSVVRVCYARRIVDYRGLSIMIDVAERLVNRYQHVEVYFVGRGTVEDENRVKKLVAKYQKQIFFMSIDSQKMNEIYSLMDISVIPTIHAEGTSLTAVESMLAGLYVIATRVGGLTDLVIDHYNGRLISPHADALFDAIADAVEDEKKMVEVAKRGREVAMKSFSKTLWKKRWVNTLDDFFHERSAKSISNKPQMATNIRLYGLILHQSISKRNSGFVTAAVLRILKNPYNVVFLSSCSFHVSDMERDSFERFQVVTQRVMESSDLDKPDFLIVENRARYHWRQFLSHYIEGVNLTYSKIEHLSKSVP